MSGIPTIPSHGRCTALGFPHESIVFGRVYSSYVCINFYGKTHRFKLGFFLTNHPPYDGSPHIARCTSSWSMVGSWHISAGLKRRRVFAASPPAIERWPQGSLMSVHSSWKPERGAEEKKKKKKEKEKKKKKGDGGRALKRKQLV